MDNQSSAGRSLFAALVAMTLAFPVLAADPNAQFKAENDLAMHRMMSAMMVKPTGDIDRDFAEMMIPHHQGAIEMAEAEIRYGKNEQLKRIAQEIIVDQQQEIAAMRLALGDALPPSAPAPTGLADTASTMSSEAKLQEAQP
jgi:hypothetical protein